MLKQPSLGELWCDFYVVIEEEVIGYGLVCWEMPLVIVDRRIGPQRERRAEGQPYY